MNVIAIGRIVKPIGTRGEVKILPLTDDNKRFANLPSVWIGREAAHVELKKILNVRIDARQVVLNLQGVETVQEAEKMRDSFLFVPREEAVKLQNGRYFADDIIGCEVVTEEQVPVGVVTDFLTLPMNDIWVVKKDAKEVLIPAVKSLIRKVEIEQKRITVHALDGLLE